MNTTTIGIVIQSGFNTPKSWIRVYKSEFDTQDMHVSKSDSTKTNWRALI